MARPAYFKLCRNWTNWRMQKMVPEEQKKKNKYFSRLAIVDCLVWHATMVNEHSSLVYKCAPIASSCPTPDPSECNTPTINKTYIAEPPKAPRYDLTKHWVQWRKKGWWIMCRKSLPSLKYSKCNVYSCSNTQQKCFVSSHT